jgi:hypothetical protein
MLVAYRSGDSIKLRLIDMQPALHEKQAKLTKFLSLIYFSLNFSDFPWKIGYKSIGKHSHKVSDGLSVSCLFKTIHIFQERPDEDKKP